MDFILSQTHFLNTLSTMPSSKHNSSLFPAGPDFARPPAPGPEAPIIITVSEPRIQIVEIGQTVTFDCSARPRFQTPVSLH